MYLKIQSIAGKSGIMKGLMDFTSQSLKSSSDFLSFPLGISHILSGSVCLKKNVSFWHGEVPPALTKLQRSFTKNILFPFILKQLCYL